MEKRTQIILSVIVAILAIGLVVMMKITNKGDAELAAQAEIINAEVIQSQREEIEDEKVQKEQEEIAAKQKEKELEEYARDNAYLVGLDENSAKAILEEYINEEESTELNFDFSINTPSEGTVLLTIDAKSIDKNEIISVDIGTEKVEYNLSTMESKIYLPFEAANCDEIVIKATGEILVKSIILFEMDENVSSCRNGMWIQESYSKVEIDKTDSIGLEYTFDCVKYKNYLLAINIDGIYVLDTSSEDYTVVTSLKIKDGVSLFLDDANQILYVTSSKKDISIVDISDVNNLNVINKINLDSEVSSIVRYDNYLYVTGGNYGIAIFDVSDINNPIYIETGITDKIYENCIIEKDILYATSFVSSEIDSYRVTNSKDLKLVASFKTDGKPYGVVIKDNYLITTIEVSNDQYFNTVSNNYGLSNGFEIIDISNVNDMKKVSSSMLDGRYEITTSKTSKLYVTEDNVYFSNQYNGVYIYNISKIEAPIREMQIWIPRFGYTDSTLKNKMDKLWAVDTSIVFPATVTGFCIDNDHIFVASAEEGLFDIKYEVK